MHTDFFHSAVHVLNGDMLHEQLVNLIPDADYVVFRECLIEGEVCTCSMEDLLTIRETELKRLHNVDAEVYRHKTRSECERLLNIRSAQPERPIILWFENDAFCQANLWFITSLFQTRDIDQGLQLFRVFPSSKRNGFETFQLESPEAIRQCIDARLVYTVESLDLSHHAWSAYCSGDVRTLLSLSNHNSDAFQEIAVVAEILEFRWTKNFRTSLLAKRLQSLESYPSSTFSRIFEEFSRRYPEYGFGDLQLLRHWNALRSQ